MTTRGWLRATPGHRYAPESQLRRRFGFRIKTSAISASRPKLASAIALFVTVDASSNLKVSADHHRGSSSCATRMIVINGFERNPNLSHVIGLMSASIPHCSDRQQAQAEAARRIRRGASIKRPVTRMFAPFTLLPSSPTSVPLMAPARHGLHTAADINNQLAASGRSEGTSARHAPALHR